MSTSNKSSAGDELWCNRPDIIPFCAMNCSNEANANVGFSFHPGCCGMLMCDGSAHMVSENLSLTVLYTLITVHGNEAVTDQALN